jgi:hypothetical protein
VQGLVRYDVGQLPELELKLDEPLYVLP